MSETDLKKAYRKKVRTPILCASWPVPSHGDGEGVLGSRGVLPGPRRGKTRLSVAEQRRERYALRHQVFAHRQSFREGRERNNVEVSYSHTVKRALASTPEKGFGGC